MESVKLGDIVVAMGHVGRFEVTKLENNIASLKLIATSVDGPVELGHEIHNVTTSKLRLLSHE